MSTVRLKDTLSQFWGAIQGSLFPWLEAHIGPLNEKQEALVTILEMLRVEDFLMVNYPGAVGRPSADRTAIARAFVAKSLYNLVTTRQIIDRLITDYALRQICGWEHPSDVPSESTFSRAFKSFAELGLGDLIHKTLIEKYQSTRLIGHISRDSTAIAAREKVKITSDKQPSKVEIKYPPGRPKKGEIRVKKAPTRIEKQVTMNSMDEMLHDVPQTCDIGTKKNAKGYKNSWKGYKLHVDVADGGVPISCLLTSASTHDSQVALPLALMSSQRVDSCYDLMDSAYDCKEIREYSKRLGHTPLIDFNRRSKNDMRAFEPHEKMRYRERSTVERFNAQLKDSYGGENIYVRGTQKVMLHLMFGVLVISAIQIMRLLT